MKTILVTILLLASIRVFAQQEKLNELMDAFCKVNKFNGSVLVAQKGKILLRKGYGLQTTNTQNDVDGIFQIYSVTKSFTSTLILKLVELQKLSLTDKLSKFYPNFPKGDSITIEHLLSHTAGIFDYTKGYTGPDMTEASFIKFLQSKPLDFPPGTKWSYSNSGYWLLGFIIAKLTGMSYEAAISKYIFKPLHMNNSGFNFKRLQSKHKTTGFASFTKHQKREAVVYEAPAPFAAGAIYSTVDDLYKFHQALQRNSIISKASLEKAYKPIQNNYGLGWMINTFEGHQLVSHSGGAAGYRSNFVRLPDDDICIILLNNHEQANVEVITKGLLSVLFNKPYKIPTEIQVPPSVLARYTGAYPFKPFTLYVTIEDGRLAAQPSYQPKSTLLAEKENYFYVIEANAYLEFTKDSGLVLHGDKDQMTAKHIHPTWGLLGTATEKEWDDKKPDILFTEMAKDLWELKNIMLKKGLILFRLNNDWGYHYGGTVKKLEMFGPDIAVEAGTYNITLDCREPGEPIWNLQKQP